ncbi:MULTISPECIES: tyrosine-type recombinase/integrase [unclassified Microcoleus]|uniref:tyrosine-type recombinase/integrase n=1 Tax=unclassified Microcoleus TaxID=2642155 RepID=UPI002FD3B3CA
MRADKRPQLDCDVVIYGDKGSLALRFPKRHSALWEALDGKSLNGKPKCLGIGKYGYKDNPDDRKRAAQIAIAIESDLDHPEWDKLFDPTLAKYGLGGGKYAKMAEIIQMPGMAQLEPEITVGEMWEDYLVWKETQVEPTTFIGRYKVSYTNIIKGVKRFKSGKNLDDTGLGIWDMPVGAECVEKILQAPNGKSNIKLTLLALSEAFVRAKQLAKLNLPEVNPFFDAHKKVGDNPKQKYQSTVSDAGEIIEWWQIQDAIEDEQERDKRAFTKKERDIIIKAFYESDKASERQIAPLIEFSFRTGCRPSEAFALRWQDVMFERGIIRFSKSYCGRYKITKRTKTKEIRLFPLAGKLIELLDRIKPADTKPTDLVFVQAAGQCWNSIQQLNLWLHTTTNYKGKTYYYPGVVTRLVEEGNLNHYLPPYHMRHTYITLTAHACNNNTSALLLLAHACGNSPEVIMKHYLDIDRSATLPEI